ncbi:bacteriocin immunity protein [Morganella psychrotolerans]
MYSDVFYTDNGEDDSPAGILKMVKEWRASQGKQEFRKG